MMLHLPVAVQEQTLDSVVRIEKRGERAIAVFLAVCAYRADRPVAAGNSRMASDRPAWEPHSAVAVRLFLRERPVESAFPAAERVGQVLAAFLAAERVVQVFAAFPAAERAVQVFAAFPAAEQVVQVSAAFPAAERAVQVSAAFPAAEQVVQVSAAYLAAAWVARIGYAFEPTAD